MTGLDDYVEQSGRRLTDRKGDTPTLVTEKVNCHAESAEPTVMGGG